jgi:hypothetical protein
MTGDGSDTTLTLSTAPVHENNVSVYFDGVYQSKSNYSISGTTLTFSTAPPSGVAVEAITATNTSITTATQLSDADGDTLIQTEESSDEDKIRFDTGGSERMIIDGTSVGIGTSTPGSLNANANNLVVGSGSGGEGITIYSANDNNAQIFFADGTSGDAQYRGVVRYAHDVDRFEFWTAGAIKSVIDSSGNVGIGTTTTDPLSLGSTGKTLSINSSDASTGALLNLESADTNRGYLFGNSSNVVLSAVPAIPLVFKTTNTERMRIDSNGTVQIGSSTSHAAGAAVLHLHQPDATSNAYLHITQEDGGSTSSDGMSIGMLDGGANATIRLRENGYLTFFTNNSERMRLDSDGRLGINETSTGNARITLQETSTGSSAIYALNNASSVSSSTSSLIHCQFNGDASLGTGTPFIKFANQNDFIGSITGAPSSVAYNTSSDRSLKENIVDASSQLDIIKAIQVREFDWKKDSHHDLGVIAQELYEVIPNVVTEGVESDDNGWSMPWSVDYGRLTPYLVKAIQEQQEQIEQLKAEVQTLKENK